MKPFFCRTIITLMIMLLAHALHPCSTLFLKSGTEILVAKNFDFFMGSGCLMLNRRDVQKHALLWQGSNPARWTSRFGSVTFNQLGREFPYSGMNEAGLVVEIMWLETSEYPLLDARPELSEQQWIQYQLDTSASVGDVLASDRLIRISRGSQPVHFMVADRRGEAATIEFIQGKMVVHRGRSLPVPVLTNDTYVHSLQYLRMHEGFGGTRKPTPTYHSLDRFVTAARMTRDFGRNGGSSLVDHAFTALTAVAQGEGTVWSIVHHVNARRIFFHTRERRERRSLSLEKVDFSCSQPVLVFDLEDEHSGDILPFMIPYSTPFNLRLVQRASERYRQEQLVDIPETAQRALALYPEALVCQPKKEKP